MTPSEEEKYRRARKRIEEIKGFYIHLFIYLIINTVILVVIYVATRDEGGNFWEAGHFFTLFFWGIGLLFHAIHTFKLNPFFGEKWEKRQIRKYMEKDREESKKYH
jgi:hypothetical protein